ncbi:MAG: stage II sporulation protein M [Anaerolineales bacterium]|nr:stage II sporulation protein M [Anaerolineales bacterium]
MLNSLRMALVITRREVHDQFRDWRIIIPILLLTLIFPALMNFTARQAINFVERYNAPVIGDRLIPFLLMVVGFFPISISLVIALESFVGEKERRSIEPLLCSPLSDGQLYLGKLLAAMAPPLLASYLGIGVYLVGVYFQVGWRPEPILLAQILLLTTVQAILMVSGAVVISSQTTSVRAANLLASFIIIPMALLIQGESIVMFWARYHILWWAILGQAIIAGLLIRTGVAYFNREEMLGRELDVLDLGWAWLQFKRALVGQAGSLWQWYRLEIPQALGSMKLALLASALSLALGYYVGVHLASVFALPPELLSFDKLSQGFIEGLETIRFFSAAGVASIWLHNLRAVALATLLGIFSFGVLGILVLMLPMVVIGYIAANTAAAGASAIDFLFALVIPHGIVEIPAMILAGATILSLGASLTAPVEHKTIGESFLEALAKCAKITLGLALPLFLIAALLEVYLTPQIAVWIFSR